MALIVEDGTNVTGADSYISLADAESYYLAYYGAAWAGADADKDAALRRAAQYLDGLEWRGTAANGRAQAMAWPRSGVIDCSGDSIGSDEVPIEVQRANALLGFYELANVGGLSPDVTIASMVKREKVDVIEVEYRDAATNVKSSRPVITSAMDMLRCLIFTSNQRFLKRA